MSKWIDAGSTNEIPMGEFKTIENNGITIAIFNLAGNFYAIDDCCPHQHLPIADGLVEDFCITCPHHGAKFDMRTGERLSDPVCDDLTTYQVRIENNIIQVFIT